MTSVAGVVLAAGAGTRFGSPKALVPGWLDNAVTALRDGGCAPVFVMLGAAGVAVPDGVEAVYAPDWERGMSASLRAALARVAGTAAHSMAVVTVDVPSLCAAMVSRLVAGADEAALRQAEFGGRPGHPVVIGRDHWAAVAEAVHGDVGARPYLVEHGVTMVECADLGSGQDVDER